MNILSITVTPVKRDRFLVDWVRMRHDGTRHIASMFVRAYWRNWLTWLIPMGWNYQHIGTSTVYVPDFNRHDLPEIEFDIDAGFVDYEREE